MLAAAAFTAALPSPPMLAARLEALRPPLRSAGTKLISFAAERVNIPGASYDQHPPEPPPPPPAAPVTRTRTVIQPVYVEVETPVEVYYPFPVYTAS